MRDDEHHNTFDDDNTLDFIIYEELEKQVKRENNGKRGCLGLVLLLALPAACWLFEVGAFSALPSSFRLVRR